MQKGPAGPLFSSAAQVPRDQPQPQPPPQQPPPPAEPPPATRPREPDFTPKTDRARATSGLAHAGQVGGTGADPDTSFSNSASQARQWNS
jgi:hypothetical protein